MMKTKLIVIFILTAFLSACTKEQYADEKMNEIAGDWILYTATLDSSDKILIDPDIYPLVCDASVTKQGENWYFDYTLPILSSGKVVSYHKIQQEITWNPAAGQYLFHNFPEAEWSEFHLNRMKTSIHLEENSKQIILYDESIKWTVCWSKK